MKGSDRKVLEKFVEDIEQMKLHATKKSGPAFKKPLLLLLVLSRLEEGLFRDNIIRLKDIEKDLNDLIATYGGRPTKSGTRPEQPFHHLSSSPFWNLHLPAGKKNSFRQTHTKKTLRAPETYAYLDPEVHRVLVTSARARSYIANLLLNKWWSKNVQEDMCNSQYLNLPHQAIDIARTRSKDFVQGVLDNYRKRCAICGFDATLNNLPFGLDAAHIKWYAQGGPDSIENGLALCKLHHWSMDRGVVTVEPGSLKINVSRSFLARERVSIELLEKVKGKSLEPYRDMPPDPQYLEWHNNYIYFA